MILAPFLFCLFWISRIFELFLKISRPIVTILCAIGSVGITIGAIIHIFFYLQGRGISDPEALASALNKISYGAQTAPMRKTAGTQSVSAMMIANPFSAVGFSRLFSTHPPTDERIARLMQMANEMNGTPIAPPTYSTRVGR